MDFNQVHVNSIIMECSGNSKKKDKAKIEILQRNNFICHVSSETTNPQFLRRVWKKKKKGLQVQSKVDPTSNNCMCVHKSFVPSSKYNIIT